MKTYKDINDFIADVFPLWFEKDAKHKKTDLEERIEYIDSIFLIELEEALKDKKAEKKEEVVKGKKVGKKGQKATTADNA